MSLFLLIFGMLLVSGAFGVLLWNIIKVAAEVKEAIRTGSETGARLKGLVGSIREEVGRLRYDLQVLSDAAAAWPRATVVTREAVVLARNIRSLGTATALLSTLRGRDLKSCWRYMALTSHKEAEHG